VKLAPTTPTVCPCGAKLWSKAECLASDDEVLRYVGEAYLDDHSGYCLDEDDVVPYEWAFRAIARRVAEANGIRLASDEERPG
jgi:hypothetical protein